MQPTEQAELILPKLSSPAGQLEPSDLDNITPCDEFAQAARSDPATSRTI